MSDLKGKVAIVTGASKGIGAGIAKSLGAAGAAVVVNYASSKDGADRVVADIKAKGGKAIAVKGDVAKAADVARLFDETEKAFGAVDVLVNNAGIYKFQPLDRDHRGRIPPPVQHQRARHDPRHQGSGQALRPERRQHHQHFSSVASEQALPTRRSIRPPRARSTRSPACSPPSLARAKSASTPSRRAASRPRALTPPASSAAISKRR